MVIARVFEGRMEVLFGGVAQPKCSGGVLLPYCSDNEVLQHHAIEMVQAGEDLGAF